MSASGLGVIISYLLSCLVAQLLGLLTEGLLHSPLPLSRQACTSSVLSAVKLTVQVLSGLEEFRLATSSHADLLHRYYTPILTPMHFSKYILPVHLTRKRVKIISSRGTDPPEVPKEINILAAGSTHGANGPQKR